MTNIQSHKLNSEVISRVLLATILKRRKCYNHLIRINSLQNNRIITSAKGDKTMKNPILLSAILIAICLISWGSSANAKNNSEIPDVGVLDLIASENKDYWHPNETLKLRLPLSIANALTQNMVIELDSVDITAMLQNKNGELIYKPVQLMTTGQHELRVVEYTQDGDIEELGFWSFEVRESKIFQNYEIAGDTQLRANYRTSDKNIGYPEPREFQGQAISQIGFNTTNGDWYSEGQFDLLYDSIKENRINNRAIDNNEFLFSVGNQHTNAKIGHHSIGVTSLVMNNFRHRGVSFESRIASINSRVTGFSFSSANISGFSRGLGIGDSQQRVDGATFDTSPFSENPRSLYLTGTWLQGRSLGSGNFIADLNSSQLTETDGDAWSFSGESLLFNDKLRLRAEYAQTDYDFEVSDDLNSDRDTAHSLLATYADISDFGVAWNIGATSQKIGTFFRSLGNLGLPGDKELIRTFAGAQWPTFGIQANIEQQKDNVEQIQLLPRIRTDLKNFSFNWTPAIQQNDSWLGKPSMTLSRVHQSQKQTFTPIGFLLPQANNDIRNWQLSSNFSYQKNSWGLGITNTELIDRSSLQNNSETMSLNLFTNLVFGEESDFNLSSIIAFNEIEDKTNNINSTSISYSVQSAFVILPKKLDASVDLNLNQNQTSDISIDGDNFAVNFSIRWIISEANANKFGFELNMSGIYNDYTDNLLNLNSIEAHQTFLTLTATLPSRMGEQ